MINSRFLLNRLRQTIEGKHLSVAQEAAEEGQTNIREEGCRKEAAAEQKDRLASKL